jgi:SAM-dependent methyltransferase
MEVLEFRKISTNDEYNEYYNDGYAWSRVYEYQLVLDSIKKYYDSESISIHNTSWGFVGVHVLFKNELDKKYSNTIHSDIILSDLPKTTRYDITQEPPENFINSFDVVVNVSTLEEVNYDHIKIFENLLKQVKVGGLLICTFDLPGLQVDKFENLFGKNLTSDEFNLTNHNSKLKNISPSVLECGIMVIKK